MHLNSKYLQIIKPVLIVTLVLAALIAMLVTSWVKIEDIWLIFPMSGIRISTAATAIVCFSLVLFMLRRSTIKSIYYALLAVIFPMGLYEIAWYYTAASFRAWDLRIFEFAALFGWILLGVREVFRKRPSKLSIMLYVVFAVTFVGWILTGFQFNDYSNSSFTVSGEIFNEVSK